MNDMSAIYEESVFNKGQVLTEDQKRGTVEGKVKPNMGFEGSEKAQKGAMSDPFENSGKPAKPTEGPSNDPAAGKPTKLGKKVAGMKDSTENKDEMKLSFDDLYRKTITEEMDDAVVPAADPEGANFDEDIGDFTPPDGEETDVDDEVDLASELRMLADRLNEIADKLSIEEGGPDELGGEKDLGGEPVGGEDMGGEDMGAGTPPPAMGESVRRIAEAIKSEPTPKVAKKTSLNPKMSLNPKASGYTRKSGAGKAKVPSAGKDRTGTLSVLGATKFGPKMSQNPQGSGPAVKGSQAPLIA